MAKKKLPWFPCYPAAWLEDTRHMTDAQARVYWDLLCLLYLHDGAISASDKWIAYELHVHINKWRAVRKFLISDGKLVENGGTLTNSKVARVCLERQARTDAIAEYAQHRESERQLERWESPQLPLEDTRPYAPNLRLVGDQESYPQASMGAKVGGGNWGGLLGGVTGGVTGGGKFEIPLTDQRGHGQTSAPHLHHTSTIEERKKGPLQLKHERPLPSHQVDALVVVVGQETADRLVDEYYASGLAEGATSIANAFPGWLVKCKGVDLGPLGGRRVKKKMRSVDGNSFDVAELTGSQLTRLCGGSTQLPTAKQLATRKKSHG